MAMRASRRWRAASVLALAALGAAACGGGAGGGGGGSSSSKTVTVAVVANPDITQMEQLISNFEKANPGIKVKSTRSRRTRNGRRSRRTSPPTVACTTWS